MTNDLCDRAADVLTHIRRVAVPLSELAGALAAAPELLANRLRADPRFSVIEAEPWADLSVLAPPGRGAYAAALQFAGLTGEPVIVLLSYPPAGSGIPATVPDLLRETLVRLLADGRPAPVAAAEEASQALGATPVSGTEPSTTPLHGPPAPAPAPLRLRPRSPRPLPSP